MYYFENNTVNSSRVYNWFWIQTGLPGNMVARMAEAYHVGEYFKEYGQVPRKQFNKPSGDYYG